MIKATIFFTTFFLLIIYVSAIHETSTKLRRRLSVPTSHLNEMSFNQEDMDSRKIIVDETMKTFDKDEDGFLSFNEFEAFCSSHPFCPMETHLYIIFDLADADDDENVSYEELVWMAKYYEMVIEKIQRDDKNGDGFITSGELPDWCISDHDYNHDGRLSFTEYIVFDLVLSLTSDSLSSWSFEDALSISATGVTDAII